MGCHLVLHFATLFGLEFDIKDSVFLSPPAPTLPQLQKVSTRLALSVLCRLPFLFDWYRSYFDQSKGLESFWHQAILLRGRLLSQALAVSLQRTDTESFTCCIPTWMGSCRLAESGCYPECRGHYWREGPSYSIRQCQNILPCA